MQETFYERISGDLKQSLRLLFKQVKLRYRMRRDLSPQGKVVQQFSLGMIGLLVIAGALFWIFEIFQIDMNIGSPSLISAVAIVAFLICIVSIYFTRMGREKWAGTLIVLYFMYVSFWIFSITDDFFGASLFFIVISIVLASFLIQVYAGFFVWFLSVFLSLYEMTNLASTPRLYVPFGLLIVTGVVVMASRQLEASMQKLNETNLILRRAQTKLEEVKEQERLAISRELHDGPLQDILAAQTDFRSNEDPGVSARLRDIARKVRSVSNRLRPSALSHFGVNSAITSAVMTYQSTYPNIDFITRLDDDKTYLKPTTRLALFRIFEQGITNALRYSDAVRITVFFTFNEKILRLEIFDNGKGFIVPEPLELNLRQGHLGLMICKERAESIQGTFRIFSIPGEGTQIIVEAPIRPNLE